MNAIKRGGAKPVDGRTICRVMALRKEGKTQEAIASELGVAQGTVSVILRQQGMGGPLAHRARIRR